MSAFEQFQNLVARLQAVKDAQRQKLQNFGQEVSDDWSTYSDALRRLYVEGGSIPFVDVVTADPDTAGGDIIPSAEYAGMYQTIIRGDPNFKPENLAIGLTAWGKRGSAKPHVVPADMTWPFPTASAKDALGPPTEGTMDTAVKEDDANVTVTDKLVLVDDAGRIIAGYMYGDTFEITSYDPTTTEFTAKGWRTVNHYTTGEAAGTRSKNDFISTESPGGHFLNNLRMCAREKLYYQGEEIWPVDQSSYTLLPQNSWYKGQAKKSSIKQINIVNAYEPTGTESESWAADVAGTGGIMCYIQDTTLTIANNVSEKIMANADSVSVFASFTKTVSINGIELFDTSAATTMFGMFYRCIALTSLDLSSFDTSNVTDMNRMFYECIALTSLNLSGFDTSNVTDMNQMFYRCKALTSLDLSSFDTSNVTDMNRMFYYCAALTSLDLSSFNTSLVTNMYAMFRDCESLTSLDVSSFDTSNVTNMELMFASCESLTSLDLSSFVTSNVTSMHSMFIYCKSLTSLDLSSFDTSNVTLMLYMFDSCNALTSLDLSSFDTSNVTLMEYMFCGCHALTSLDLSNFDTSNVTNMRYMFVACESLTSLDLSSFDTSLVTIMDYMFCECVSLKTIYVGSGWDTDQANTSSMFQDCGTQSVTYK